jgi:hypothetical protein
MPEPPMTPSTALAMARFVSASSALVTVRESGL